ncbi:nuclear transcription factor Y subunit gamma isoform 2-T5 [Fundulus diaphanus]
MSADGFGAGPCDAQQTLQSFWPRVMEEIRNLTIKDFRVQELPLARIKKIMKLDEDVKMISAEAPVLFAKAAQIFITELTLRAWIHTEDNKRRTLQRNDIAMAITKFDQFDFLIDIVPRDDLKPPKRQEEMRQSVAPAEPVQYYFTLAQQPGAVQVQGTQQGQQAGAQTATTIQPGQIIITQPQQGQSLPRSLCVFLSFFFILFCRPSDVARCHHAAVTAGAGAITRHTHHERARRHAGGRGPAGADCSSCRSPGSGSDRSSTRPDHAGHAADHHQHRGDSANPGAAKYRPATVHPSSPASLWSAGGPGADSDSGKHAADHTDRGAARTAAIQPVYRRTAVSDSAGDDASGTGTDPAHVHPVHQPDDRCAGHAGQHRLSPTRNLFTATRTPARLMPTDIDFTEGFSDILI